jgi:hypothetical protein
MVNWKMMFKPFGEYCCGHSLHKGTNRSLGGYRCFTKRNAYSLAPEEKTRHKKPILGGGSIQRLSANNYPMVCLSSAAGIDYFSRISPLAVQ